MSNLAASTRTVHATARDALTRPLCGARVASRHGASPMPTDLGVTCGNCQRKIDQVHAEALVIVAQLDKAVAEAHANHAAGNHSSRTDVELRSNAAEDLAATTAYLAAGETVHAANFLYVATVAELELAYREQQRRQFAVTSGRTEARSVSDWRSSLSLTSLTERAHDSHVASGWLVAHPGTLVGSDLWALGMTAFDYQRDLEIIHSRVIGECSGCWRNQVDHGWGHRVSCPMYTRTGDGVVPVTEPWSADDIQKFWTSGFHAESGK